MTFNDPLASKLAKLRRPVTAELRVDILDRAGLVDHYCAVATPLGDAMVAFNRHGVSFLSDTSDAAVFAERFAERYDRPLRADHRPTAGLAAALRTGRGRRIGVDLRSASTFQRAVLEAVRSISVGEVRSYQWVAQRIGRPAAVRAVGTALATNPVPLVIPCHRVVRADAVPGGYVFGADIKAQLLRHEGANLDELAQLARRGIHYIGSDTTRVFCVPSCHQARRIADGHRVFFPDAAAARSQRFRPCRMCTPDPAAA